MLDLSKWQSPSDVAPQTPGGSSSLATATDGMDSSLHSGGAAAGLPDDVASFQEADQNSERKTTSEDRAAPVQKREIPATGDAASILLEGLLFGFAVGVAGAVSIAGAARIASVANIVAAIFRCYRHCCFKRKRAD